MEYTTRGTCSRLIKFDVDGEQGKRRAVCYGLSRKHTGRGKVS